MDCGVTFAKYATFFVNFVFVIAGVAMIAIGAYSYNKAADFRDFLEGGLDSPTIIMIIVGCIIFAVAFLGCCGAIKENTCMLYLFAIVLLLAMVAEVAVIWTAISNKGKIDDIMSQRLNATLKESETNIGFRKSWDFLQHEFHCCGGKGPDDWNSVPNVVFPKSCCDNGTTSTCSSTTAFQDGCKTAFLNFVKSKTDLVAFVAVGVGVFQLLSFVFACCLYSAYRRQRY